MTSDMTRADMDVVKHLGLGTEKKCRYCGEGEQEGRGLIWSTCTTFATAYAHVDCYETGCCGRLSGNTMCTARDAPHVQHGHYSEWTDKSGNVHGGEWTRHYCDSCWPNYDPELIDGADNA